MRAPLQVPSQEEIDRLDDRLPANLGPGEGATAAGAPRLADNRGAFRGEAKRDRDRIQYCSAFQRLGGVTQVTEPELGLTFHTRLTHSLKVAQVSRRCAEKLLQEVEEEDITGSAADVVRTLKPDAAEAAGLAHDLGHPPFGHVAEQVLNTKAAAAGGFEGNPQSFRILTRLAIRSPDPGLALTRRTLNGCLKYPWLREMNNQERNTKWGAYYGDDEEAFNWVRQRSKRYERSLTAHLMDWADDITFAVHDLDDFYRAGLVPLDRLAAESEPELDRFRDGLRRQGIKDTEPVVEALGDVLATFPLTDPYEGRDDQRAGLRDFASELITDYLRALTVQNGSTPGTAVLVIADEARAQVSALKKLTWGYVVMNPSLAVLQRGRRRIIEQLFDWYEDATRPSGDPRLLPPSYRTRVEQAQTDEARIRIVTDIVAGLTEAAALALFRRMSGIDPGTLLDAAARVP
jgi:dGTPase